MKKRVSKEKFPIVEESHKGFLSLENIPDLSTLGHNTVLGIQVAPDGRVWICVNGISLIRFNPNINQEDAE